jgi:hypothetical protein
MTCERTVSESQESERPVATDVFLHNLEPLTQEALRRAVEQGLTPSGLDFAGDDDSIVILGVATEPRDAHLTGRARATVSCLLRELAAKLAGDPSF